MLIKVCGMREAENIREVAALGVDMMGFVFWPQSPRFVQMISAQAGIIPDYSEERLRQSQGNPVVTGSLESQPKRVGVFVDDMPQNIVTRVFNYSLDYIQLHGEEPRETCENLRLTLDPDIHPGIKIIKAISVSSAEDFKKCAAYIGAVDMFLFDTRCKTVGGSGEQFDWSILRQYDGGVPFLLSGGMGPDDATRVKALRHPMFAGIDLNSRFEVEPGVKDVVKLRDFIQTVREG
ncbi:phosphoribosylanthranilate isomerase [Prevotella sp. KH2C16]|uniref:phosphoribosylanthranilate isomerase n=1 Tax=Prevotella sp. KH2C16 TaxID=1855325 RepID=UPI000A7607F5|nr:phosphoribosylanthranilate isomerase [Prevotella sp. KH2C16]